MRFLDPLFPTKFIATTLMPGVLGIGFVQAIPMSADLVLTEGNNSVNRLQITINAVVSDTETTTLTGGIAADFEISPQGLLTQMTLYDGRVDASTVRFRGTVFFVPVYDVTAANLSASVATPVPPGEVGVDGNFDATQYSFTIDQGSVQGTSAGGDVNLVVTPEAPFEGRGSGAGTVVLSQLAASDIYQDYQVRVSFPIDINSQFDAGGTDATIAASGVIEAVGQIRVPKSEYLAWTVAEGIPGAPANQDHNQDGVPNGLAWALGLTRQEDAQAWLPRALSSGGFALHLPDRGLAGPIRLQVSPDLANWSDMPIGRLQNGANPLPKGSKGIVQINPSGLGGEFMRLQVEP